MEVPFKVGGWVAGRLTDMTICGVLLKTGETTKNVKGTADMGKRKQKNNLEGLKGKTSDCNYDLVKLSNCVGTEFDLGKHQYAS